MSFVTERSAPVKDADVVLCVALCVEPPALVDAMTPGAILVCFVHAHSEPALVRRLLERKITTCFAMERVPRITRAQAMDALSSQSALAGDCAVALGMSHLARVVPETWPIGGATFACAQTHARPVTHAGSWQWADSKDNV